MHKEVQGKHLAVRAKTGRTSQLCNSPVIQGTIWWWWVTLSHAFQTGLQQGATQGPHKSLLNALQKTWRLPFSMSVISDELFYHSCLHLMSPLCLQTKAFDRTWREANGALLALPPGCAATQTLQWHLYYSLILGFFYRTNYVGVNIQIYRGLTSDIIQRCHINTNNHSTDKQEAEQSNKV